MKILSHPASIHGLSPLCKNAFAQDDGLGTAARAEISRACPLENCCTHNDAHTHCGCCAASNTAAAPWVYCAQFCRCPCPAQRSSLVADDQNAMKKRDLLCKTLIIWRVRILGNGYIYNVDTFMWIYEGNVVTYFPSLNVVSFSIVIWTEWNTDLIFLQVYCQHHLANMNSHTLTHTHTKPDLPFATFFLYPLLLVPYFYYLYPLLLVPYF